MCEVVPFSEKAAEIACQLAEACFIGTGAAVAVRIESMHSVTMTESRRGQSPVTVGEAET